MTENLLLERTKIIKIRILKIGFVIKMEDLETKQHTIRCRGLLLMSTFKKLGKKFKKNKKN
jgi:hypothetical protein